jgi:hypothetical protein
MYKEKVCMMYRKVVIVCSVRCCSGACLCVQTQRPKRPRFRVQCVCVLVTGCLGGDVSLGCIRARSKDARHSKTGMLVTSNGRPWPRGSLLRDHSSLRDTVLVRKHIPVQAVPHLSSNAIDRLDDVEGENLAHQDIQHDNVAARHLENTESGWWQEESQTVTIIHSENELRWPERSKRQGGQLEGRPRVNNWRQRPFERRRTHQLQTERNTAIGITCTLPECTFGPLAERYPHQAWQCGTARDPEISRLY